MQVSYCHADGTHFLDLLPEPDQVRCDTVQKASEQEKADLIDKVDAFIFDCDGESAWAQAIGRLVRSFVKMRTNVQCRCHLER